MKQVTDTCCMLTMSNASCIWKNARIMLILACMAISDLRSPDSIAMPSRVKTNGR